jgi:hypothetical protein
MSANAYVDWADIPQRLIGSSRQHIDSTTQAKLIAFDGCPFAGQLEQSTDGGLGVEFPFPRNAELRDQLIEWLLHWGIPFTVLV